MALSESRLPGEDIPLHARLAQPLFLLLPLPTVLQLLSLQPLVLSLGLPLMALSALELLLCTARTVLRVNAWRPLSTPPFSLPLPLLLSSSPSATCSSSCCCCRWWWWCCCWRCCCWC